MGGVRTFARVSHSRGRFLYLKVGDCLLGALVVVFIDTNLSIKGGCLQMDSLHHKIPDFLLNLLDVVARRCDIFVNFQTDEDDVNQVASFV